MRVLHFVGGLERRGVETWLMKVFAELHDDARFDFVVHTVKPQAYEPEVRALGGEIYRLSTTGAARAAYPLMVRRLIAQQGPYDIAHAHLQSFGALALLGGRLAGVPVRVIHSHNTSPESRSLPRLMYESASRYLAASSATHRLAASAAAGESLFGSRWSQSRRSQLLHCGIDLQPFVAPAKTGLRAELGLQGVRVLAQVGRLEEQKNHGFSLRVLKALARFEPRVRLLLVGAGQLRERIASLASELGVQDLVVFAGSRDDVPAILNCVADVFLFPSLWEGLGLAFVEAQAAGLQCLVSNRVPREADVIPTLVRRLPLSDPEEWARAALAALNDPRMPPATASSIVSASDFDLRASSRSLLSFYHRALADSALPTA